MVAPSNFHHGLLKLRNSILVGSAMDRQDSRTVFVFRQLAGDRLADRLNVTCPARDSLCFAKSAIKLLRTSERSQEIACLPLLIQNSPNNATDQTFTSIPGHSVLRQIRLDKPPHVVVDASAFLGALVYGREPFAYQQC